MAALILKAKKNQTRWSLKGMKAPTTANLALYIYI